MNIQLTDRIKQNARSFSKGQRLIARYIEEHYDKVAFMTASKLGAVVGVSESTVVRFATSWATEPEDVDALLARYAPQLALYARALTQITGLPVREKNLFLLEKETGYILP